MEWYQILSILGVPSICATIVTMIITEAKKKIAKSKAEEAERLAQAKEQEARKEEERTKSLDIIACRFETLEAGMQSLLRRKLREMYTNCTKAKYACLEDRDDFENMYQRYHSLGSNGVMDDVREKFLELPSEKPTKRTSTKED